VRHPTSYQPSRSQHLAIADQVRQKYNVDGVVIIHYVLMDTPLKLLVQTEIHRNTSEGKKYISFERLEV